MRASSSSNLNNLIAKLNLLWKDEQDHLLLANTIRGLDACYEWNGKIANESDVEEIKSHAPVARQAISQCALDDGHKTPQE